MKQTSSPNINMMTTSGIGWEGHVECMEEKRNAYKILVGKPEYKRPLGRHRL
jgi:hypothetical protein